MDKTNEYVNKQEKICSNLLKQFNNELGWFNKMKQNEEKSIIDYTCIDKKGRKCHVELKKRNANIDTYDTILLDATKLYQWTKIGESGATLNEQRLYFNFMDDGVIIFDINNLSAMTFYPSHKQWNPTKNAYEHRDKIGLPIKNAIVYKKNENNKLQRVQNERYIKTYKT